MHRVLDALAAWCQTTTERPQARRLFGARPGSGARVLAASEFGSHKFQQQMQKPQELRMILL